MVRWQVWVSSGNSFRSIGQASVSDTCGPDKYRVWEFNTTLKLSSGLHDFRMTFWLVSLKPPVSYDLIFADKRPNVHVYLLCFHANLVVSLNKFFVDVQVGTFNKEDVLS